MEILGNIYNQQKGDILSMAPWATTTRGLNTLLNKGAPGSKARVSL